MIDDAPGRARSLERSASSRKIGSGLLALSSAAVLTVYSAGYYKTRAAAERFATAERRPSPAPLPVVALPPPAPAGQVRAVVPPTSPSNAIAPTSQPRRAAARTPKRTPPAAPAAAVSAPAVAADPLPQAAPPPPEPPAAPPSEPPAVKPALKDGTYSGWGTSRHGDIQASVVIEDGRIVSASITQCLTRYSCSWIEHLPGQIVSRQSPECDFVSGATQSTNAFYYAVVEALSKAK
jgi:uncharacterized protein with FMN-binding domain